MSHDHLISCILSAHRKPFNGGKLNFTICYMHDDLISRILSIHRKPFNGGKLNFTICYMTTWYHIYWVYIENHSTEQIETLLLVTWPLDIAHIERTSKTFQWRKIKLYHIVANSSPTGVRSATPSNGDRLAHRHGQFCRSPSGLTPESNYGQGFSLSLFVHGVLVRGRVNRPASVYLNTHTGTPPRKSTSP